MTDPETKLKLEVDAPLGRVAELLAELTELPRKYDGGVQWSNVVERGSGFHVNEGSRGIAAFRERVTKQESPGEVRYSFEPENGAVRTICCKEVAGRTILEVGGQSDGSLERSAERLKEAAEDPPRVPAWLQTYFDTVDKFDIDALTDQITPDCVFQAGNLVELRGREAFRAASLGMWSNFKSLRHHILGVYEDQGRTITEVLTEHSLRDGRHVLLPAITLFRRSGDLVSSVRIYGDMAPLFHGWSTGAP